MHRLPQLLYACGAIAVFFPVMLWLAGMMTVWPLWTAGFAAVGVLAAFLIVVCGAWAFVAALDPAWKQRGEAKDEAPPAAQVKTITPQKRKGASG